MKLIIHTDGGARGNPGPAAVGVVIEKQQETRDNKQETITLCKFGKRIGETTNNVAEYTAVIEALAYLRNNPIIQLSNNPIIQFYLDSNLVVQQLSGVFKVKDSHLRKLFFDVRMLEHEVGGVVSYTYVPREQNRRADFLVNQALDGASHVSLP